VSQTAVCDLTRLQVRR